MAGHGAGDADCQTLEFAVPPARHFRFYRRRRPGGPGPVRPPQRRGRGRGRQPIYTLPIMTTTASARWAPREPLPRSPEEEKQRIKFPAGTPLAGACPVRIRTPTTTARARSGRQLWRYWPNRTQTEDISRLRIQGCQPAFLTTPRGEVRERAVRTRRKPGGAKRRAQAYLPNRLIHPSSHETRPFRFTG